MNTKGEVPGLAVILVGERPDSEKYVSMKKKLAEKVHTEKTRQMDA
jgi:5,10-methylene-tetrahydrofolate dehydrogenase/methenyl tetrahydrofolate cyclohydrolase